MNLKNIFLLGFLLFITLNVQAQKSTITIHNLRTEYKTNPFIEDPKPRLSWELKSSERNQQQTAYRIGVASSLEMAKKEIADVWDSGKKSSNQTNQIAYQGATLNRGTTYFWWVKVWNQDGEVSDKSPIATWEMGLNNKQNWQAKWIGNDLTALGKGKVYHLPPAPYFRKEANLKSNIKKARLYVTALGLYEFYINGKKIGNDSFTPGWTDYNKRVYYQAYDITSDLKKGKNAFGSIISEGWYAGYLGYALLVKNPIVKNFLWRCAFAKGTNRNRIQQWKKRNHYY